MEMPPRSGIESEGTHLSPEVAGLFDASFGSGSGAAHQARYAWQYGHGGTGTGSVLRVFWHKGEAIGSLGSLPCTLYVDGVAHTAKFTADLCSAPLWRNKGIGARLMQQFVKEPGLSLAFAVSPDARTLLLRMGFQEVPLKTYFRVIRLEGLADHRYPVELRDSRLAPLMRGALKAVDVSQGLWNPLVAAGQSWRRSRNTIQQRFLESADTLSAYLPSFREQSVEVEGVPRFPGAMDILQEPLAAAYPVAILPSAAELNRRYADHPSHTYKLALAWRQGLPVGYAVWRIFREGRQTMAHLSALVASPTDTLCLNALIQQGLSHLHEAGAYAVKAVTNVPGIMQALDRHLFFERGQSPGLYFYCPPNGHQGSSYEALSARLSGSWLMGLGTSDADVG